MSKKLLTKVFNSSPQNIFSLQVTGGGIDSLRRVFTTPGASNSVLNAGVPYCRSIQLDLLDIDTVIAPINDNKLENIDSFCSRNMAIKLAETSKYLATEYYIKENGIKDISNVNIFGVACTASLVTSSDKFGEHQCYVAVSSSSLITTYSLILDKGLRNRDEEDSLCSDLVIKAIADAAHIDHEVLTLKDGDILDIETSSRSDPFLNVLNGDSKYALFIPSSNSDDINNNNNDNYYNNDANNNLKFMNVFEDTKFPSGSFVYPGSFNPLHEGHIRLALAAKKAKSTINNNPLIIFEISALNADKPPISPEELLKRVNQFSPNNPVFQDTGLEIGDYAICISSEPLFIGKSKLYCNSNFVMGVDTFKRLTSKKYYSDLETEMIAALATIKANGIHFMVGGRTDDQSGDFLTMDNFTSDVVSSSNSNSTSSCSSSLLPPSIMSMFTGLTEEDFRVDLSSTELRKKLEDSNKRI